MSTAQPGSLRVTWDDVIYLWQPNFSKQRMYSCAILCGSAIKQVCMQFVDLCRQVGLLATASVAIDGSKFKAVNTRDNNFTRGKAERRRAQWRRA